MPSFRDFPARGKVIRVEDDHVVFSPVGTNYEIKLLTDKRFDGPVNVVVDALMLATGRKLWTVSSGGNFVSPIFGPPRIVQGRIKFLDQTTMVLQAGLSVVVKLPGQDSAYDLTSGAVTVGALVNVTILPGARFELLGVTLAV